MDETVFDTAECLARVRRHDQAAARALVDHLHPLVMKLVWANLPRRGSPEDLTQDIFLKMFKNLEQYHGEVPIEHWVSRIAVNHCLNAIRDQGVRPEWRMSDLSEEQTEALEAAATSPTDDPHPAHALGSRELVAMLLDGLSPKDRLIIRMLEMEDRSIEEIQQVTGWSGTVIRVRAFRARRKLNRLYLELKKKEGL